MSKVKKSKWWAKQTETAKLSHLPFLGFFCWLSLLHSGFSTVAFSEVACNILQAVQLHQCIKCCLLCAGFCPWWAALGGPRPALQFIAQPIKCRPPLKWRIKVTVYLWFTRAIFFCWQFGSITVRVFQVVPHSCSSVVIISMLKSWLDQKSATWLLHTNQNGFLWPNWCVTSFKQRISREIPSILQKNVLWKTIRATHRTRVHVWIEWVYDHQQQLCTIHVESVWDWASNFQAKPKGQNFHRGL